MKVLVVDDDRDLVDLLRYVFQREGYSVVMAFDGTDALAVFQEEAPALVIMDMIMPKCDGLCALREMRQLGNVPVIILSALNDEDHIVNALRAGADDYIVKPFRPRELVVRVEALLRRCPSSIQPRHTPATLEFGAVQLEPTMREVTIDGRRVRLTRTECALLQYLMLHRDVAISVSDLIAAVWGYEADGNNEVVKVTISKLRHKVEPDPSSPRYIINIAGFGYKFQSTEMAN